VFNREKRGRVYALKSKVLALMAEKGLTLEGLAERYKPPVDKNRVARTLDAREVDLEEELIPLCKALGVEPEELIVNP